jgi:hypothetical protein
MLKYVSKFALDILPSVVATIIGAYIVNHYIVAKPADAPAAAAVSTSDPAKADPKASSESVAAIPEAGIKAKGISERAILEKTATERPAVVDRPADTAGLPAEPRRHQPVLREKAVAKAVQAPAPAAAPPTPVEAAVAPEENRDANDLARAAIERLRGTNDASPHVQEAVRTPEAPKAPETPHVASAPPVQPLPPPIMVSAPNTTEAFNPATGSVPVKPPYGTARIDDPRRPTPPADIPSSSPPVDLRAETALPPPRERTSVADDVLSAAKSVFHAVLPR